MTDTPKRPTRALAVIGWREFVILPELCPTPLKAKIDTGARTSALHAFAMERERRDGMPWVTFEVHPEQGSERESTRVSMPIVDERQVRSSTGHTETRPVIVTPLRIGKRTFDIEITLTSRDEMGFRLLLGRSAVRRRFLISAGRSFLQPVVPPAEPKDRA